MQAGFETNQLFYTTDLDRLDKSSSMHITGVMNSENIQHMIRNCHSKKRCRAVWEEMAEINDGFNNEARFCEQCQKIVYLVTDNREIPLHLEYKDCVAIHDDTEQDYFLPRRI